MEELIMDILFQLQAYLSSANEKANVLDVIVDYWIPIISAVILVGSALTGVIKYCVEKNRDFNEKVLSGVYAPLFQYIVKQEYMRQLDPDGLSLEKYPILGLRNVREKDSNGSYERQETEVMGNTELLAVKNDLNFGLVPKDLLVLLNVYEIALELRAQVCEEEFIVIQSKLRANIIEGYLKYRRKLGLESKKGIFSYKNDKVSFVIEK